MNREDLEPEEYQETKSETLEQMREFQSSLAKLAAGDLSLTDYFAAIQLVTHIIIIFMSCFIKEIVNTLTFTNNLEYTCSSEWSF